MVKDFDTQRTSETEVHTFKAGGEEFAVRSHVSPEHLQSYYSEKPPEGMKGVVAEWDRWITGMVVPEDAEKWQKVREQADPPLSLHDIEQIGFWLLEVGTGRPTTALSPSRRGREQPKAT